MLHCPTVLLYNSLSKCNARVWCERQVEAFRELVHKRLDMKSTQQVRKGFAQVKYSTRRTIPIPRDRHIPNTNRSMLGSYYCTVLSLPVKAGQIACTHQLRTTPCCPSPQSHSEKRQSRVSYKQRAETYVESCLGCYVLQTTCLQH